MRTIILIASFCLACGAANDDQMEANAATADAAIKRRFEQTKLAAVRADKARLDSLAHLDELKEDSVRIASGLPTHPQLSAMVRRLPPDSLRAVPPVVRATLNQLSCFIPQPYQTESRNAVSGAFSANGAIDWAVVCSVGGKSNILLISSHTGALMDSIPMGRDSEGMQNLGGGKWGFAKALSTLPRARIQDRQFDDYDNAIPQPIDHDALSVVVIGDAIHSYYRAGGRWYGVIPRVQ